MRLALIGCGYLGTTHAACMSSLGHEVMGIDTDTRKIAQLRDGVVPFYEPNLSTILHEGLTNKRIHFSTSYQDAVDFSDLMFITVGTPQKNGEQAADMQFVDAAVHELAPLLTENSVIVGKSTVPVGTANRLEQILYELSPVGQHVELAWNPEFLREGRAVFDTLHPDRIVIGVSKPGISRAEAILRTAYATQLNEGVPCIVTDLPTAELTKMAANAFLATKISFINAMSEVCEAAGADVTMLADALGFDDRIGRKFLNAGLGFGGGCLPKDIRAFIARTGELGATQALTFLREVDSINMRRRSRVVEIAREVSDGSLVDIRVAVLGTAFKPNSDDVRDSPALEVAGQIQLQGAHVNVFDPQAMDNSRDVFPTLNYAKSAVDACREVDLVLVLTEWPEFCSLDPHALMSVVRKPSIIDGRNCLDATLWRTAGWSYRALGRPASHN